MSVFADARHRLRSLFRRSDVEQEMDDELRFHVDMETEKNVRAGMTPDEARRQAVLAFGGVERIKEDVRDARGIRWLETLARDVRYAVRGLRGSPGFTAAVVVTLALGIGANAAMFGIIDRLMFRPPAHLADADRVHRVYLAAVFRGREQFNSGYEYTRYLDLRRWTSSFDVMAAANLRNLPVGTGESTRELSVSPVSAEFFQLFDMRPAIGRFFGVTEDSTPFGAPVAVLSHDYWRSEFAGSREALGSTIQIGPATYTIIGVAPPGFAGMFDDEPPVAFIPITAYASAFRSANPTSYFTNYNWGWLHIYARRKRGVSEEQASRDLTQAYRRSWEAERDLSPSISPLAIARPRAVAGPVRQMRGPLAGDSARVMRWVAGVALIVLVIACANVANLLLARALRRRREIAMRLALGASRRRLASQLLVESMLLALLGAAGGLAAAAWGGAALRGLFLGARSDVPVLGDPRTLAFAAAVGLLTGLVTGLAPLLHAGREDLVRSLKGGVREGQTHGSAARTSLLVFQAALSMVLLVGAGLFVQSLRNVQSLRLGYDVEPVLLVGRNARGTQLTGAESLQLTRRLEQEARTIPGVETAARALTVPFYDNWSQRLHVEGIDTVSKLGRFTLQAGSPDYFRTAGTRILRGRAFTDADREGAPPVVIVTQAMGRVLWKGDEPIGKCIRVGADTAPCATVVGIAEDMRQNSLMEGPQFHYYLPIDQFHPSDAQLYVRTRGPAVDLAETVRRRLQPLMPGASYVTTLPLSRIIDQQHRAWRIGATMFVAFGGLALLVAALGLYSVIAYDVAQRRHELGVRVALGATRGDITWHVLRRALALVISGVLVGGAIAFAAGRWLGAVLYDQSPRDPVIFGLTAGMLVLVAMAAAAIPARRAAGADPMLAIRTE